MRPHAQTLTKMLAALLLGGAVMAQPVIPAAFGAEPLGNAPPPRPALEEPEALTRGPVHEAYAEPVSVINRTDLVIPAEPPAPIDEAPPTDRPEGDAIWVPGYWAWDPDAEDFIWVSGCWRSAPPGTSWVPGYWAEVEGGWQWVPGFWRRAGAHEVDYLPEPPEPFDVEPTAVAPSIDHVWVPGCWYWHDGRYIRRHGYWLEATPNWVWVPSHYVWSPRGYVFVRGHWDFPFERRGVLFAPAYIPRVVYVRPSYVYSPTVVLNVSVFQFSLFTAPRYCHYYFGDYYDVVYVDRGIYPWYDRHHIRYWCDPIYTHDRWRHGRDDHDWEGRVRRDFDERRQRRELRPAHTYREMRARADRAPQGERERLEIARPLAAATTGRATPVRFEQMDDATRRRAAEQGAELRRTREERRDREAEGRHTRATEAAAQPVAPQPTPAARERSVRERENPDERRGATAADRRETRQAERADDETRGQSVPVPSSVEQPKPAEPPNRREAVRPRQIRETREGDARDEGAKPTPAERGEPRPAPAPTLPPAEPSRDEPKRSTESRSEPREAPRDADNARETRAPRQERERKPDPPPPSPAPAPEPAPAPPPAPERDNEPRRPAAGDRRGEDNPRREAPRRDDSPNADAPSRGDRGRSESGDNDRERRSGDREAKRGR